MKQKDWWMGVLLLFLVLFLLDFFDVDNQIYHFLLPQKQYYDLSWWGMLGAVGSIIAAFMAYLSIKKVNQQLEIEQEPFVVLDGGIVILHDIDENKIHEKENDKDREDNLKVKVKNIGRGPAIEISITRSQFIENEPLFENSQPHSINLFSTEIKNDWKLDEANLIEIVKKQTQLDSINDLAKQEKPIYLYVHYFDQLKKKKQVVKVKLIAVFDKEIYGAQRFVLKVMENKRIEFNH